MIDFIRNCIQCHLLKLNISRRHIVKVKMNYNPIKNVGFYTYVLYISEDAPEMFFVLLLTDGVKKKSG